jgi:hypothetical protein
MNAARVLKLRPESITYTIRKDSPYLYFSLFILTQFLITFIEGNLIVSEELLIRHYEAIITSERIEKMLAFRKEFWWVSYLFTIVYYFIKFLLISMIYLTGVQFLSYKTSFKQIFNTIIICEFIFVIPRIIKILWFSLVEVDYSLEDLQNYNWYSLKGYVSSEALLKYFSYPLYNINLFEFAYLLTSSYIFSKLFDQRLLKGLMFVICTYGIALFFWATIMVTLNLYLK